MKKKQSLTEAMVEGLKQHALEKLQEKRQTEKKKTVYLDKLSQTFSTLSPDPFYYNGQAIPYQATIIE